MGPGAKHRKPAGARSRRELPAMSDINVTPFVDVVLVLLIIFIVAAPLLTAGVPVKLPQTAASPLPSESEEPLTITISSDGKVRIQSQEINPEELVPKLRAVAAERQTDRIFLRADGSIRYEYVMQVMGALNSGGFTDIALVTETGGPALDGQEK